MSGVAYYPLAPAPARNPGRTWPWVVAGVAGVVLIGGVAYWRLAVARTADAHEPEPEPGDQRPMNVPREFVEGSFDQWRRGLETDFPDAVCHSHGETMGPSRVPGGGFLLKWRLYERPTDEYPKWLMVYAVDGPNVHGHADSKGASEPQYLLDVIQAQESQGYDGWMSTLYNREPGDRGIWSKGSRNC